MKVLLFGASGNIGRAVAQELLSRGHTVTGVTRTGAVDEISQAGFTPAAGDVTDPDSVAVLAKGHDAVASAAGPRIGKDDDHAILVGSARALIAGLKGSDVRRLVVVGGAGSLKTGPGKVLLDSPHFPEMWRANAEAQTEALGLYREVTDLDWTFISPAAHIGEGERTGKFRISTDDTLLTDANGESHISYADYAVGFADELENGNAIQRRIALAY